MMLQSFIETQKYSTAQLIRKEFSSYYKNEN